MTRIAVVLAMVGLAGIGGCRSVAERYEMRATAAGMAVRTVEGQGFRHRVFGALPDGSTRTRVYLEGDGTPWLRGREIATDPTPRRPFALELLRRDPATAVLVGRPCYHGFASDAGCDGPLWTDARYGEAVVESLAAAVAAVLATRAPAPVTLVGYSGGGTLAVLLAERLPAVDRVITVAANLDVAAWAASHGYIPLTGSLDPIRRVSRRRFEEIHLVGQRDRNVAPAIFDAYGAAFPHARIERFPFDHTCCWVEAWPVLLERFDLP